MIGQEAKEAGGFGRDILEWNIPEEVLAVLLKDRSTDKNLIWATDDYAERDKGFGAGDEIRYVCHVFPNCHTLCDKLSWSHYRLLAAVANRNFGDGAKELEHFTDKKVHAVLKNSGLPHKFIGNTKGRNWLSTDLYAREDNKISSRGILGCDVLCLSMPEAELFFCGCQVNGKVFWQKM